MINYYISKSKHYVSSSLILRSYTYDWLTNTFGLTRQPGGTTDPKTKARMVAQRNEIVGEMCNCMLDRKCQTVHSVIIYIITSNIPVVTALVSGLVPKTNLPDSTRRTAPLQFLFRFRQMCPTDNGQGSYPGTAIPT